MNHRGVAEQIVWVTAGRLLSRGSLVAASIILARTLEVQAFASFSYFLLTISMLALYASMGMGVTANRYFVGADNPDARQSRTIAAIVTISVGFSIVLTCAVMFVPEKWLVGELSIPRWAIIIGILAYSLEVVPQNAMNGLEKYRQDAFLSVLSGGFVIVMVIYASRMQNLELAMVALIGGSIIRVVGGVLVVIRAIGWRQFTGGFPFTMSDVVRTLKFSLPLFLVSLLYSAGPWLVGRIILSGDDGEHALALYAIGLQWFSLGMFLPASVSRISVPRLARSIDNPRAEDPVRNHVIFGMKLSVLSALTVAVIGLALSEYIMDLYGNNYRADKWFLGAFLSIAVLASITQMLGNLIIISHHQWGWLKNHVLLFITMVLVAYALMSKGGWAGPLSFLAAYSVSLGMALTFVKVKKLLN